MAKHKVDTKRRMDGSKTLWHMDRVMKHYDHGERIAPVHIDMGIAKFCNVKCVFCYGQYQQMSKDYIQEDALIQTMRDAGDIGVKSIAVVGDGEPTCNPHFYRGLYAGRQAGVSMATSTNGVLVNSDAKREAILDNCDWMRFCISAGTRDGYKSIHGVDKFDTAVKNIEEMVKYRDNHGFPCEVGMQAVFVPTLMAREMVDESKLAKKLGVDYFVIKQCSLPDDGATGMMQFDVNDYDKPEIQDALQECEELSDSRTEIIPKWNIMAQKGEKPYEGCLSIPLISEMSGNGDWYPCGYMFGANSKFKKDFRFGNVHDQSLKEIFESDRYWDIIERMKDFNVQTNCKGCCRQDKVNEDVYNYVRKPRGVNFI